ncbi:MAG TPA: sulfite exporter TauE/SafE family protein [Acidimicrobiia bacterium]|nr:sulfite exporter TauE/SafE family protein [Acidimicrobiia bacterium]
MANEVVLVAVGCLTGVLAGMLGAGGGFATVALLLAADVDPHVAVGTALVYLMIMGGWGTFMHVHLRSVDRRLALAIGASAAVSALAGAQISEALDRKDLVLALALFTAAVSGVSLAWPPTRRPVEMPDDPLDDDRLGDGPLADGIAAADERSGAVPPRFPTRPLREVTRPTVVPVPPAAPAETETETEAKQPLAGAVIGGSFMGLLKGLFGVGGAFLIVPVMSRVGRVRREVAVGSSLFAILVASLVAAVRHTTLGNVDGSDLLALVPGGLFGAFVGARAAKSMSPASIRRVFLAVMLASTVYLVLFRSAYE